MKALRSFLLLIYQIFKAVLASVAFPFGFLLGCLATGFRAGVEVSERTGLRRDR